MSARLVTSFVFSAVAVLIAGAIPVEAAKVAPPLPPPTGNVVHVSTPWGLASAVANLTPGTTIMLADGIYDMGTYSHALWIDTPNVAIRGASGNRDAVVLIGNGMNVSTGGATFLIHIAASDVLIADLTLKDVYYHLVQIHGEYNAQRPHLYNLRLVDSGEQFVKVTRGSHDGIIEYCEFEFTTTARWYYTHGIDVLGGERWIVRDNTFRNIRGPDGVLTGGAILFWHQSKDTIVERNEFYECDFGVAFGNPSGDQPYDHERGIIRNNFFFRQGDFGDVAITLNYAKDFKVYNNTCIINGTFPWVIDYRFSSTSGEFRYNITDGTILARNGATATLVGNLTNAQPSWFVDFSSGDLHLAPTASPCIDQAAPLADVPDDYDTDGRPVGAAPDIGADEYRILGDADGSGGVDVFDAIAIVNAFGSTPDDPNWDARCDFDHNWSIDVFDVITLVNHFGESM